MLRGTVVKNNINENSITPGIQKLLTDKSHNTAKAMSDKEKLVFRDHLQKTDAYKRVPTKGRPSGLDKYIRIDLDNDVRRILNLDTNPKCRGIEKFTIPSNVIDIYTRPEKLLGLKLSGQSNTLTEASNLIDELYKRAEIENERKYRNALNKFSK